MLKTTTRATKVFQMDAVWYWSGGTMRGEWRRAFPERGPTGELLIEKLIADIERGGFIAIEGKLSIGPPEGAPEQWRFDRIIAQANMRKREAELASANPNFCARAPNGCRSHNFVPGAGRLDSRSTDPLACSWCDAPKIDGGES